jgi:hypothetical protein
LTWPAGSGKPESASPEFAATYAAIARRRGKKIATIAIARKLLARAYHLLLADAQSGLYLRLTDPPRPPRDCVPLVRVRLLGWG